MMEKSMCKQSPKKNPLQRMLDSPTKLYALYAFVFEK